MKNEGKDNCNVIGTGVGYKISVGELNKSYSNVGYREIVVDPQIECKGIVPKHHRKKINPLEIKS